MVDRPLGQRGGQHLLALGDGDEAVAQPVEPELGPGGLADAPVEMMRVLHMSGRAGRGGEHPLANAGGQILRGEPASFENLSELPGDGEFERDTGLGLLDPERERTHVDPFPAERQHFFAAHAGVEPEPERIADRGVVDLGLDAGALARQDLGRRRDLAPRLAVELAAAGDLAQNLLRPLARLVDGHRAVAGGSPAAAAANGSDQAGQVGQGRGGLVACAENPAPMARKAVCRQIPEAGAGCPNVYGHE